MKNLIISILGFFDFFHKKKIIEFLRKIIKEKLNLVLDIGAHKGESIDIFLSNFEVGNIISFEASPINFDILKKKEAGLKKKFSSSNIKIENIGLGSINEIKNLKQFDESSSSTLSKINKDSKYFKKKFNLINLFKKKDNYFEEIQININTLDNYLDKNFIQSIDLMKIDTEGFEFEILNGAKKNLNKFKLILFEHHYDDMILKNYNFSDIHGLLVQNNFFQVFKAKMPFRKTFEYIYINNNFRDHFKF